MFQKTKVCAAVLTALGAALPLGALAQQVQPERIEVTGSRIKSIDTTSASPITSLSEGQIKAQQAVAVE
jgi:iron complex outermembrane receptor protein